MSTIFSAGEAKFCAAHKGEFHVNVRHRRCLGGLGGDVCTTLPSFGDADNMVPRFCRAHKLEGHVYLAARRHVRAHKSDTVLVSAATPPLSVAVL